MAGLSGLFEDPGKTERKKVAEMVKKELPIKDGITVHRLCCRFGIKNHFALSDVIGEMESKGEAFLTEFEHDGRGTMYPKYCHTPNEK